MSARSSLGHNVHRNHLPLTADFGDAVERLRDFQLVPALAGTDG